MENVSKVVLVLENCEEIELSSEEIDFIDMGGVKKVLSRVIGQDKLRASILIDHFCIELNEKSDRLYTSFATTIDIHKRLKCCDVVCIVLIDDQNEQEEYVIDWTGDNPNYDLSQFYFTNKQEMLIGSKSDMYEEEIEHFYIGGNL